jgi:hypothetical protein
VIAVDNTKLLAALDEVNTGLEEMFADFERIRQRKEQLEATAKNLKSLLGLDETIALTRLPATASAVEQPVASSEEDAKPMWMLARDMLRETGLPTSVPQMVEMLARRGVLVNPDGLRVAMIRRGDIFGKGGYGFYTLLEWGPSRSEVTLRVVEEDTAA